MLKRLSDLIYDGDELDIFMLIEGGVETQEGFDHERKDKWEGMHQT